MEYKVPPRSLVSNFLTLAISVGLAVWSFYLIRGRLTSVTSLDAVINGTLIDVKAPAEGTITEVANTGDTTVKDKPLVTLKNERVSKLKTQEVSTRISDNQAQLQQAQARLDRQLALLKTLEADQENQQVLENVEAQKSLDQVMSDLQGAKARYQLAVTTYKRASYLKAQGAYAQAAVDSANIEMQQRQAEVKSLEARLQALRTNQKAAKLGLSLSKTRSNFDPRIRLEELQLQIADQRSFMQTLRQNIKSAQAELVQANADMQRLQKIVVKAPSQGVVWRMAGQKGKYVEQGESLGQILDCDRRWVDVVVDEAAVRSLQPNTPASIELYASKSLLEGRVSMIRSGIGRLTPGEEVAVPISQNLPRTTQVRVDLNPNSDRGNPKLNCYVGYTGRVTFKVK